MSSKKKAKDVWESKAACDKAGEGSRASRGYMITAKSSRHCINVDTLIGSQAMS